MGTVPVPYDWIAHDGLFVTATDLEAGVGDVFSFLLDPPGCQLRRTTAQTIPNTTPTAISFDAEDSDNDGMHNPGVNPTRITCNTPGRYLVGGAITYDPGSTGSRETRVLKNGTGISVSGGRVILPAPGSGSLTVVVSSIEVALVAGDFLELQAVQTQGASLTTTATNGVFPVFRARWIGP